MARRHCYSLPRSRGSEYPSVGLLRGLRRSARFRRPIAPFRHELVELGLVLGVPQAVKEIAELALLLFESPQRLGAVLVKGPVAAGRRTAPPFTSSAHAIHLLLHTFHLALPTVMIPAAHSSAPDDEGQCRKA